MTRLRVAAAVLAAVALLAAGCGQQVQAQPSNQAQFLAAVAAAHGLDVSQIDPAGAEAMADNLCWAIDQHQLDPVTLAGWQQHWHQPHELALLRAAQGYRCPLSGEAA